MVGNPRNSAWTGDPMIGVVGGMGPYAGLELVRRILSNTRADRDQDHLPVVMLSAPSEIEDRTRFLLGKSKSNPGHAIARIILDLEAVGASIIGIPCNTAHAPPIFQAMTTKLEIAGSGARTVNMVEELGAQLLRMRPQPRRVGLLATTGTVSSGVYEELLGRGGAEVLAPPPRIQSRLHRAISDPRYGIKARPSPPTARAMRDVHAAATWLADRRAQVLILGCTELPLAVTDRELAGIPVVDPMTALARALVRAAAPDRLRRAARR